MDLLALNTRYNITLHDLLPSLLHLEYGAPPHGIKPAAPFVRSPLRGLWHKHWFSARFVPNNLLAAAHRKDSLDWIWEIANEGDVLTEEIINELTHRMTTVAFYERHSAKQITGEWIIFLPRGGLNYYLCLGTHAMGDERLFDKINTICALDFPDVAKWIEAAAAAPGSGDP